MSTAGASGSFAFRRGFSPGRPRTAPSPLLATVGSFPCGWMLLGRDYPIVRPADNVPATRLAERPRTC